MLPAVAGLAFVIAIITTVLLGRANSARLGEIERGHVPALQACLEIDALVGRAQRAFQDAVAAQDDGGLNRADEVRTALQAQLDILERSGIARAKDTPGLRAAFDRYFWPARAMSHRLIGNPGSADVLDSIGKVTVDLRALQAA